MILLVICVFALFIFLIFTFLKTSNKKIDGLQLNVKTHLLNIDQSLKSQIENCDKVAKCFSIDFYEQQQISPVKIEVEDLLRIPDQEIRGIYFEKIAFNGKLSQADKDALTQSYSATINSLSDLKQINFDLNKNLEIFLKDFSAFRVKEEKTETIFRKNINDFLNNQTQIDYQRDLFPFFKTDKDKLLKIRGSELKLPAVAFIKAMGKCENVDRNTEVKLAVQEINNIYDEAPILQEELKVLNDQHSFYFANCKLELQNSSIKVEIMSDYFKNS